MAEQEDTEQTVSKEKIECPSCENSWVMPLSRHKQGTELVEFCLQCGDSWVRTVTRTNGVDTEKKDG
jgi:ribosomal protein S27AE